MTIEDRINPIDNIAHDDKELTKMAKQLASIPSDEEVILDPTWKEGKNFETAAPSAFAILIQKDSAPGAVRVYSDPVTNVVTGLRGEFGIVLVVLKPGESCRLFGRPSVRWFCRSQNKTN
jgi:hypothetical protein